MLCDIQFINKSSKLHSFFEIISILRSKLVKRFIKKG